MSKVNFLEDLSEIPFSLKFFLVIIFLFCACAGAILSSNDIK